MEFNHFYEVPVQALREGLLIRGCNRACMTLHIGLLRQQVLRHVFQSW
jgi:hypothetical protein